LYGIYTWAVYVTPILGGLIADRWLGTHRSLVTGGWIIVAGHLMLAATELFGGAPSGAITLDTNAGATICFMGGLLLVTIGTGFFKPCVSVMVGQLYAREDPRRDAGFTYFYMGINLGAALAPIVAGTLGETVGWHWGFGAAAVGMIAGIVTYQRMRPRYLAGIGLPPNHTQLRTSLPGPRLTRSDWRRLGAIVILALFGNIAFWTAFEQADSSMNVFAAESTDRTLWGVLDQPFPATWYQSINPLAILVFAPLFAWLWLALGERGREPSTPLKFCLGLWLLGLAFLAMVFGALEARSDGLAGAHWLLITYVVYTWGELCLSPVGLSMVTRLAPRHLQSLMMGFWFFTMAFANLLAGLIAAWSVRLEQGEATFILAGLPGFYLLLVIAPIVAGLVLLALVPRLNRWSAASGSVGESLATHNRR
jgi:POT family proton-dependent oligopeptide transporter